MAGWDAWSKWNTSSKREAAGKFAGNSCKCRKGERGGRGGGGGRCTPFTFRITASLWAHEYFSTYSLGIGANLSTTSVFVTLNTCTTHVPESPPCMLMTMPRGCNYDRSWNVWPCRAGAWTMAARGECLLVGLLAHGAEQACYWTVRRRLPRDNQAELMKDRASWAPGGDAGDSPESQGSSPEV